MVEGEAQKPLGPPPADPLALVAELTELTHALDHELHHQVGSARPHVVRAAVQNLLIIEGKLRALLLDDIPADPKVRKAK